MNALSQHLIQEELALSASKDPRIFREQLINAVQKMIDRDFASLIQLLYRIDVSEKQLKDALSAAPLNQSPIVIADAIIQREKDKEISRSAYTKYNEISEEERW